MSCLNPLTIFEPSRTNLALPVLQRRVIKVPCGHCEECKQQIRNGMFVRAHYEHERTLRLGGFAAFCTWTFSDDFIPVKFGQYCFDKKLMQRYLNKLNTYLTRKYACKIKYMVFSECGHVGTHRPHHHGILFFTPLSPVNFLQYQIPAILRYCNQLWPYGISDIQELDPAKGGIRYVTKYCAKDVEEENVLSDIVEKIKIRYDKRKCSAERRRYFEYHLEDCLRAFQNRYQPFYMVSQGVGETAPITRQMMVEGKPIVVDTFPYAIPRYYIAKEVRRQLMDYSRDDNGKVPHKVVPRGTFAQPNRVAYVYDLLSTSEIPDSLSSQREDYNHIHRVELMRLSLGSVTPSLRETFGYDFNDFEFDYDPLTQDVAQEEIDYFNEMLRAQSQLRADARIAKRERDRKKKIAEKAWYNCRVRPIEDVVKNSRYGTLFGKNRPDLLCTPYKTSCLANYLCAKASS